MTATARTQVIVIGSGPGGAVTAYELARAGFSVLILEEGERAETREISPGSPDVMAHMYRRRGMTPLTGSVPIGYVEGCCVGGSSEINSGFWHRTPPETLMRWKARFHVRDLDSEDLLPHFEWAEEVCAVGLYPDSFPPSTAVFDRGIREMNWSAQEVPRTGGAIRGAPLTVPSRKGMAATLIPMAETAGASLLTNCRVIHLLRHQKRVVGVIACRKRPDGSDEFIRLDAEHVIVCAGTTETPSLLRRSGVKRHVGNTLRTHPMLKVLARFDTILDSHRHVMPLLQVKEFWPDLSLGGAYFSAGHLAMNLSDNWPVLRDRMAYARHMAAYYVAVRGTGNGYVHPSTLCDSDTVIRYDLSREDLANLSRGLARLATLLLAAGALEVHPCIYGMPHITQPHEAIRFLDTLLTPGNLSLTTVHAFSSCPLGENTACCAADSYGKIHSFENLYINDASMLPDSPGVNPQGTIMAMARRNALHFVEQNR